LHMASHIDMHRGKYALAIRSGERAVAADQLYARHAGGDGYYTTYRNHHEHQLCWAAMMGGRHAIAVAAAHRVVNDTPAPIFRAHVEITEPLHAMSWEVDIRFGQWEALLRRPLPSDPVVWCVTTAVARYARALALAALGRVEEAEREQDAFEDATGRVPPTRAIHNVPSHETLAVARRVLAGEILYRRRRFAEAFGALRAAVAMDDALPYDEPWGCKIPARHALGALLLERAEERCVREEAATGGGAGHGGADNEAATLLAEAEAVYRADLERNPQNVWALAGLHACLARRSREGGELAAVAASLERARADCDVPVQYSCFCAGCGRS
jgi:tetratricopeptide (TPR) repeat protein